MSLTTQQTQALYKLYPNAVYIVGSVAYNEQGGKVAYDLQAVEAKAAEIKAEEEAKLQAQAAAKQTALNKLMALGLTEAEALALGAK
jgi:hypothetical protein